MENYYPERGDIITLSFDPQTGHEQKGRRPALVISHTAFNRKTGMAMVCPITSRDRNFPFHVAVNEANSINGFAMIEQIKFVDFSARSAKKIEKCPDSLLNKVLSLLKICIA